MSTLHQCNIGQYNTGITVPKPPVCTLGTQIMAALTTLEFADVVLVIEEQKFRAHKVVLHARSAYFQTMLSGRWKVGEEDEVHLTELDTSHVETLTLWMNWLYGARY